MHHYSKIRELREELSMYDYCPKEGMKIEAIEKQMRDIH
jgi:hypothetical protein